MRMSRKTEDEDDDDLVGATIAPNKQWLEDNAGSTVRLSWESEAYTVTIEKDTDV